MSVSTDNSVINNAAIVDLYVESDMVMREKDGLLENYPCFHYVGTCPNVICNRSNKILIYSKAVAKSVYG